MTQKPHSLEVTAYISSKNSVLHYTCNPPEQRILEENNIECLGANFDCKDPREMLLIPKKVYDFLGYQITKDKDILKINSENLLRRLGESTI